MHLFKLYIKGAREVHAHGVNKGNSHMQIIWKHFICVCEAQWRYSIINNTFHCKFKWWLMTVSLKKVIISLQRIPQVWLHFTWDTTSGRPGYAESEDHMFKVSLYVGKSSFLTTAWGFLLCSSSFTVKFYLSRNCEIICNRFFFR